MNFVFTLIIVASLIAITVVNPDGALSALISGAGKGVTFAIKLFAIYTVWLSVLGIWQKLGFDAFLAKKSSPLLRRLFPGESDECYSSLSVNLSANFLGMGSAGTPAGMNASKSMTSPKNRTMLLVINSSSIQLIPTTIIALRSLQNAKTDIILPTVISTFLSAIFGIILVKVFVKK